jgi:hypothetical protein
MYGCSKWYGMLGVFSPCVKDWSYSPLLGLPDDIVCEVLGQLQPQDLARLESALVKPASVSTLHRLLAAAYIQNDARFLWNKTELVWLKKRPLNLECLTVRVEPNGLVECLEGLEQLHIKRITFRSSFAVPPIHLWKLSGMCRELESLALVSLKPCSAEMMTVIALNLPNLRHLEFTVSSNISPTALAAITKHCTRLEHLQVSGDIMSAEAVAIWAPYCKGLKILEFCNYGRVRESIPLIAMYCPNLEKLAFNELGADTQDAQLILLLDACPRLTSLNISYQRHLTHQSIIALSTGGHQWKELRMDSFPLQYEHAVALFSHSPALERVSLSHYEELQSDVVDALTANCPSLTHVYLARCEAITEASLCLLAQRLRHLIELNLRGTQATDAVIIALARNCTQLELLNLLDCQQFSSAAFAQLANACKKLRDVNLQSCKQLTDEAVTALSQCVWLERVDLTELLLLTDASLMMLSVRCVHLRVVHLVGCMELTRAVVTCLKKRCRKLTVLQVGPRMGRSDNALGWCARWM